MLEETSQAGGTSTDTTLPLLLSPNVSGAGECYSKMLCVLSTLHHSSVITDGPGRDIIAGPGRRQHFAILRFHLEGTDIHSDYVLVTATSARLQNFA
jgi:hypothetical protein